MATRDIYETGFDEEIHAGSSANQCPECDGRVTTNTVETVCENCGLVIDEHPIDHGPEWCGYDNDERKRTGAPLTVARHDRGLSTEIGRGTDAKGNDLSGEKRRRLARLRREQARGRWRSKAERNLAHGLGEVRRFASALELSASVRDQACQLFRSAQNEDLLRGRSIEAVAAASVYGACRCNGLSRPLQDITGVAAVEHSRVENAYRVLNRELGLPTVPPSPIDFVHRIASELGLSDGTRRRAEQLATRALDEGIGNGCHPAGLAAGCVYAAARSRCEQATQAALAECAGVTVVTVRARWEELRSMVDGSET